MTSYRSPYWFWLAAVLALLVFVAVFRDILLPFVIGLVLAYFLNPVADWLEHKGMGRTSAAAFIMVVGAIIIVGGLMLVLPAVIEQVQDLARTLPETLDRLRGNLETFVTQTFGNRFPVLRQSLDGASAEIKGMAGQVLSALASTVWSGGRAVVNFLSLILVTPLVVFYLLNDWHALVEKVRSWLPRDYKQTIEMLMRDVDASVGAFIRGQGTLCLLLALVYSAGLTAIGLKHGLVIGLVTGVLSFVPVVGALTGFLTAVAATIAQYGVETVPLVMTAGVFAVGQGVEAVGSPTLVGHKLGLHPVWLIFALFAFSSLFGFVGTVIAVPVTAALAVLLRFALKQYLASDVYRGRA